MVRRRSPVGVHDPAKAAAQIQDSLSHLTGRFEQMAGDLNARLTRIEHDVAEGSLRDGRLQSEMAESRVHAGELRDGLSQLRQQFEKSQSEQVGKVAESAAHGAAQGAMESTAPALAAAHRSRPASRFDRSTTLVLIGLVLLIVARDVPAVVRLFDGLWNFLKGLNT